MIQAHIWTLVTHTQGQVVGEHRPTKKQLACLTCNLDVKKCRGGTACYRENLKKLKEGESK
jgi:hypothetical protein